MKEVRRAFGMPPCLALTATATPEVEEDIKMELNMRDPVVHRFSVNRQNIKLFVSRGESPQEKEQLFLDMLQYITTPAIIYTPTRQSAV
ncbi:hypothetical protein, partial [Pseudomonas sp. 2822-17]|uniref:hypothetical protein n=1 Tax=Pseudomonas sp. 2822-17 TaxID=1712678 RepID=UPI00273AF149